MPKCMVPIGGRPLLAVWLDLCARHGVDDVLLNVSQHPEQVRRFLDARSGEPRVRLVVEDTPCGTAGTVRNHRDFVAGEQDFWILYSDNLTDVSLSDMAAAHQGNDGILTMGLFRAPVPEAAGIVQLDADGRILEFEEKPARPRGNLANAGLYLARRRLVDELPAGPDLLDFGHDVLPSYVGSMYGHVLEGFIRDIGTPNALADASAQYLQRRERTRS